MSDTEEITQDEQNQIVTLISKDGFQFQLPKEVALVSGTLKSMLSTSFKESATNRIILHDMEAVLIEKVVEYCFYNWKYEGQVDVPDFDVPTEMALELLVVSDFLEV
ncbi:unnamed protein product [Ambrosiozyma monospora]|uniref:Elongin-C n=1 Tax=Ambrosiozyma monospora TaxID=43982 RepID=A0A9W7DBW0_AMBMO|nr:unnamed protein product [Ambrosiozyma monospora]